MLKKTILNTTIYGIGPQVPKIAGVLILPFITPYLTTTDFGLFGVIQAYGLALSYLKTLGTDVVLTNVYIKHPKKYKVLWRHIGGMLHIWALVIGVFYAGIIAWVLGDDHKYLLEIILLNCLPLVFFATTENQFFRYYQLQQRPWPIAIRVIVTGLINVAVTYYTIAICGFGYRGWFYAAFIASFVSFAWMFYPMYIRHKLYPIFKLRKRSVSRTLKISLPVLPHFYGNYLLSSSDRVILDLLKISNEKIGRYNVAYLFGNYVTILATASKRAITPMLLALYNKNQWSKAKLLIQYWSAAFLIGTSILSIWVKDIIPFFIRMPGMENIYGMAVWVIMANNHVPMYSGANSEIFYHEQTRSLWKRAVIAVVISIALNLIFVPIFGVYAAAVITYIAYMFLAYSTYWMPEYKSRKVENLHPVRWFFLTLTATLICLVIAPSNLIIKLCVTVTLAAAFGYFAINILRQKREARRIQ